MTDQDFAARIRFLERERDTARKQLQAVLAELDAKGIELDATSFLSDVPQVVHQPFIAIQEPGKLPELHWDLGADS